MGPHFSWLGAGIVSAILLLIYLSARVGPRGRWRF
jgi:hypothetical protein